VDTVLFLCSAFVAILSVVWNSKLFIHPSIRLHTVIILSTPLGFATCAYITILWNDAHGILQIIRDTHEALAIYFFVSLLIWKVGGKDQYVKILTESKNGKEYEKLVDQSVQKSEKPKNTSEVEPNFNHKSEEYPLKLKQEGRKPEQPNNSATKGGKCAYCIISVIRVGVLQFVLLKPTLTGMMLVAEYKGLDDLWLILRILTIVVTIIALISLLYTHRTTKNYLTTFKSILKFAVIKILVFVCLVQGVILNFMVENDKISEHFQLYLENSLILVEMFPISIALFKVFPFSDLEEPITQTP